VPVLSNPSWTSEGNEFAGLRNGQEIKGLPKESAASGGDADEERYKEASLLR
jgi:hypothetical protein